MGERERAHSSAPSGARKNPQMCYGCWEERGLPHQDTPEVRRIAEWIGELYDRHSTGGGLHIVVDDWNLEDEHLDWCIEHLEGPQCLVDSEDSPEDLADQLALAKALRALSEDDRASALALSEGYWDTRHPGLFVG